jgi:type II secretory pathway pseudopilin PulG
MSAPSMTPMIRRAADESGTSLVELLVAMVLFSIIGTAAFTGYASIASTNRQVDDRSHALVDARQALEIMIRDMRAADPIDPQTPVENYDTTVGFNVFCSQPGVNLCGPNRLRPLRYTYTDHGLQRVAGTAVTFIGPSGPANLPRNQQRSAIVNDLTTDPATGQARQPIFTFYDATGARLLTRGIGASGPTTFHNCARRVDVHLVVQAEAGNPDSRVDLRTTIDLRNYHKVGQCTTTTTTP